MPHASLTLTDWAPPPHRTGSPPQLKAKAKVSSTASTGGYGGAGSGIAVERALFRASSALYRVLENMGLSQRLAVLKLSAVIPSSGSFDK